ncbi:cobyrinic acid a,c-diamide synthase [Paludisphaera borealis]|uniref:Cobyrinate a,c-diamide synthase n=1 Tax=Paludisphaera borealis TaxID=1387353 RepID=A0A1U7CTG7_9BACT|nr:cobyrinic acid a,c-diamide synthase [Paludisphaera borealis]APW62235.1 Cobyrinate a,c-diamide synthase [Paludisphaera borealis]
MMTAVPRIALATPATGPEPSTAGLAVLAGLTARRWRIQHFRSRACPTTTEVVADATGLPERHLDTWLMPPNVCRSLFVAGARAASLGLVEGTLDASLVPSLCGGDLRGLTRILDLPIVSVLSLVGADPGACHLPRIPEGTEAVILDGLSSDDQIERYRRLIRLTCGLPVVGAVDLLPGARSAVEAAARGETRLAEDVIDALGSSFLRHADLKAFAALATSRVDLNRPQQPGGCGREAGPPGFRVAYAHDDAFGCYFPDTLEALESLGAELVEFSPMRDGALPDGVDLVMIGCGFPDLHAMELAANFSMIAALRQHVCRGQRIYTEGGGTAYLGRSMIIDGQTVPGAGILPFDAELVANPTAPTPVVRTLLRDCWIGPRGAQVRGYKSGRWNLRPSVQPFECPSCFGSLSRDDDLYFRHHAVGSLIHLHLGALPEVVAAFAGPHRPSLKRPSTVGLSQDQEVGDEDDQD